MLRLFTALTLSLFVGFFAIAADEKEPAAPTGVWNKEADGVVIQFDFSKVKALVVSATAGDKSLTMTCKYTIDKDGLIKATADKVENKNEFPVPTELKKGYEFKFKVKIDGKSAHITDFAAENSDAKNVVEGEYTKKEAK